MDLSFAKQSDDKIKNLVFGFIRESIPTQSIPMVINYLCVLYYLLKEKFDKIERGSTDIVEILSNENILNQNDIIKYKSNNEQLISEIFGCFKIDFVAFSSRILKWNFDVKCDKISIGIRSYLNQRLFKHGKTYYKFHSDGRLESDLELDLDNDISFGNGDIITMEMDPTNKSLKFYKNCKEIGVEFDDIKTSNNIQYTMFIELGSYGSIKLIDFKIIP